MVYLLFLKEIFKHSSTFLVILVTYIFIEEKRKFQLISIEVMME